MTQVRVWKSQKNIWHNCFSSSRRTYQVPEIYENKEISTNYVMNEIRWNRKKVNVDIVYLYNIALYKIIVNEDHERKPSENYRQHDDCLNEMTQLLHNKSNFAKWMIFGPVVHTPEDVKWWDTNQFTCEKKWWYTCIESLICYNWFLWW